MARWPDIGDKYVSMRVSTAEVPPDEDSRDLPPDPTKFWGRVQLRSPGVRIRPSITGASRTELFRFQQQAQNRASARGSTYAVKDLSRLYALRPLGGGLRALRMQLEAMKANGEPIEWVQIVRLGPDPAPTAAGSLTTTLPDHTHEQTHLDAAPAGIGARQGWTWAGADGSEVRFIDIERGWTVDHLDLLDHAIPVPPDDEIRKASRWHGTAVLGAGGRTGQQPGVPGYCTEAEVDPRGLQFDARGGGHFDPHGRKCVG